MWHLDILVVLAFAVSTADKLNRNFTSKTGMRPSYAAFECYKCKYDPRRPLDKVDKDDFYNSLSCNVASDWDPTKVRTDTCSGDDGFCRLYIYHYHSVVMVERSCAKTCTSYEVGRIQVVGKTTTVKQMFCCEGSLCNSIAGEMDTTTLASTTTDGDKVTAGILRLVFICTVGLLLS